MRYKPTLNDTQIKYLIKNGHLPNTKLAERLKTTPQIIATYKYRARQAGIDIPKQKNTKRNGVVEKMKKFASVK